MPLPQDENVFDVQESFGSTQIRIYTVLTHRHAVEYGTPNNPHDYTVHDIVVKKTITHVDIVHHDENNFIDMVAAYRREDKGKWRLLGIDGRAGVPSTLPSNIPIDALEFIDHALMLIDQQYPYEEVSNVKEFNRV
jgi:hypothetical protein